MFHSTISIHALREEGDQLRKEVLGKCQKFLSTPSVRRATIASLTARSAVVFLSTPSVRRATRPGCRATTARVISIHALREEGDGGQHIAQAELRDISIHALREEGDLERAPPLAHWAQAFLSTPSVRRATCFFLAFPKNAQKFLSTPSVRRATRPSWRSADRWSISIHALREEGDALPPIRSALRHIISIHALREEGDGPHIAEQPHRCISIHALREEGDLPCE